jgi:hypothetical protein
MITETLAVESAARTEPETEVNSSLKDRKILETRLGADAYDCALYAKPIGVALEFIPLIGVDRNHCLAPSKSYISFFLSFFYGGKG